MRQVMVRMMAPPGKRTEILDVLRCLKGPTESATGCLACRILQDAEDRAALTYLVQWESQEELVAHLRSERFRRLLPYIELSVGPPEIEVDAVERVGGIEFLVEVLSDAV